MNAAAFWIAHGDSYIAEAVKSAESLRAHMPEVRRILITANSSLSIWLRDAAAFNHVIGMLNPDKGMPWYWYSINCFEWATRNLAAPLLDPAPDVLINLDVDTYVVEPFYDLLEVLERFDIVGTHAPARYTSRTVNPVPEAFAELNIGMLAWRNTSKMQNLFTAWARRYRENQDVYGNNDQAALREMLWRSDVRIWVAPPEYHFRFIFGGFARYPVKVLHGRSKSIEEVARRVNKPLGMRIWKKGEL